MTARAFGAPPTGLQSAPRIALAFVATALGVLGPGGCGGESSPTSPDPASRTLPPAEVPPDCAGLALEVALSGRNEAAGTSLGVLTLTAPDPDTALDFVRPYTIVVPDGGANLDLPGLSPTVGIFVSDLRFESLGDGFRQTMRLEWFDELALRATAPDCDPVVLASDDTRCTPTN